MELVDIWHFALSHFLTIHSNMTNEELASKIADGIELRNDIICVGNFRSINLDDTTLVEQLKFLSGLCAFNEFPASLFSSILEHAGMSWDELYQQYLGKNVLNFFRQDHGLKDGSYEKIWDGKEDNVHLVELMSQPYSGEKSYFDFLYAELKTRYELIALS